MTEEERLRFELDEARRERAGMQRLAQKNRAALDEARAALARRDTAIAAALRRHTADARMGHDDVRCASCQEEAWPCPTVEALAGSAEADGPDRCDVYVRARNVMRGGLRTEEIADGVIVDWWTDRDGAEHVAGVEVLNARGVEIDGRDLVKGRPHGTGPEWKPEAPTDPDRLAPAVLAEDLRSLAHHGGLDGPTREVLDQSADLIEAGADGPTRSVGPPLGEPVRPAGYGWAPGRLNWNTAPTPAASDTEET